MSRSMHGGKRFARSAARLVACLLVASPAALPTAQADGRHDDAVAAYIAAWNGTTASFDAALAADFVDRSALLPLDGSLFRLQVAAWRGAIPDLAVTLIERTSGADGEILRLRYEGRPTLPSAVVPLSGGAIRIEQDEFLAFRAGRIATRRAVVDDWTLPPELLFVAPPAVPLEPMPAETVAQFGPGAFPESIAVASDGMLYVSTGHAGAIVTVDASGTVRPFAQLDVGAGGFMMCLTIDADGALYATVNSPDPAQLGVWRFDRAGAGRRVAALPPGSVPNGLALDGRGHVLVADSFAGTIWRVAQAGGTPQVWLRHPWLAPRPLVGRFPGANGLQRDGDAIVVAVSDRSLMLRVPLGADGSAGAPEILSASLPADDFAVADDGTLYVTTHPFNTVLRLGDDGRLVVVAGPAQGVIGPTSAALGADGWLYVATDGGLYRPLPGVEPRASIVRLRVNSAR